MAHKTIVDGTEYAITGGKCMIDGTVYEIKNGKTLIDGTGYSIEFSSGNAKVTFDFRREYETNTEDSRKYSRITLDGITYYNDSEDTVQEVPKGTQMLVELRVELDDHHVDLYLNDEHLYSGVPKTDYNNKDEDGYEATRVSYTFEIQGDTQVVFRYYAADESEAAFPYQEIKITGDATLVSYIDPNKA